MTPMTTIFSVGNARRPGPPLWYFFPGTGLVSKTSWIFASSTAAPNESTETNSSLANLPLEGSNPTTTMSTAESISMAVLALAGSFSVAISVNLFQASSPPLLVRAAETLTPITATALFGTKGMASGPAATGPGRPPGGAPPSGPGPFLPSGLDVKNPGQTNNS